MPLQSSDPHLEAHDATSKVLDKREMIAALALQGILAGGIKVTENNGLEVTALRRRGRVRAAIAYADLLLLELERTRTPMASQ